MNCLLMTLGVCLFPCFLHLTVMRFGLFTISRVAAHPTAHHEGPHCCDAAKPPFPQGPLGQTLPPPKLQYQCCWRTEIPKPTGENQIKKWKTNFLYLFISFWAWARASLERQFPGMLETPSPPHTSPPLKPRCLQLPCLFPGCGLS